MRPTYLFRDRGDGGRALAEALSEHKGRAGVLILGLPRGGIPVAFEVAHALGAPLDVFTVRKLRVPELEDVAMGAIATGGASVLDDLVIATRRVTRQELETVRLNETRELERQELELRGDRPPVDVAGSVVIIVDDGMATGMTMRAAVMALRTLKPLEIVAAVPVASDEACATVSANADRCLCLHTPRPFFNVGRWYREFPAIENAEARALLDEALARLPEDAAASKE